METKPKHPAHPSPLATLVAAIATGQAEGLTTEDGKNPMAVALGRKGGLIGGKNRAASLTSQQRTAIAKKAANARWEKKRDGQ